MKRQNIFFGRGKQAELADHLYKRFMSRQWFSYDDVMTDSGKKEYPNLSSCDGYGELKKLFGKTLATTTTNDHWRFPGE